MNTRLISISLPVAYALFAFGSLGCRIDEYHEPPRDPHAGRIQHVVGGNYEIHPQSNGNLCFDVRGDKAAASQEVWLYPCTGKENQRWAFVDQPNNSSNITGLGGLCLDVQGAQTAEGTPINIYPCGAAKPNQRYRHFENGQIREVQSGMCLTVGAVAADQQLRLGTCVEGNQGQVWTLTQ